VPATRFARRFGWFLAAVLCLVAARGAWATDYHWTGAGTGGNTSTDPSDPTTQWAGAANWQEGAAPDASGTIYLPLANAGSVYAATTTLKNLWVDGPSTDGVLSITDGVTLTVNTAMYVGKTQSGKTVLSGGTCEVKRNLYLGNDANSTGFYELSDTAVLNTGTSGSSYNEYIGYSGAGTFTQSGGTHTVNGSLYLAYDYGASGTYTLSSGVLNVKSYEYIGYSDYSATAAFTQTGGTHTVTRDLSLNFDGTYTLAGGTLNVTGNVKGVGRLFLNDGSLSVGGTISGGAAYFGYLPGTDLAWSQQGPFKFAAGVVYVGYWGTASLSQTSGAATPTSIWLGYKKDSSGTYALGGTGTLQSAQEYIGSSGTGTFTQTGGTNTVGTLSIGASGTYSLQGGTLAITSKVTGTGRLILDGGALSGIGPISVSSVYMGFQPGTNSAWSQDGAVRFTSSAMYVGYSGTASLTQTTTTFSPPFIYLGYNSGASGTYALGGTGILNTGTTGSGDHGYVGFSGTGAFLQTGGTHTDSNMLYLAYNADSNGTYELGGTGALNVGTRGAGYHEYIGYSGTGTFTQTGGTHTVNNNLYLGYNPRSSGTYALDETGSLNAGTTGFDYPEYIGYSGTGTFKQTGGTHTTFGTLYLGYNADSRGTYDLRGTGALNAGMSWSGYPEYIGYSGTGSFTQTGGTHTIFGSLYLGYNAGSSGTYELSGTGVLCTATDAFSHVEHIGWSGTGAFIQTGGSHTLSGPMFVGGFFVGGSGTYTLSSGELNAKSSEGIGGNGAGTFIQTGGTNTVGGSLTVGPLGTYELGGTGILKTGVSGDLYYETIGFLGPGTFTQTGGTHTIASLMKLGRVIGVGTYELGGGTLTVPTINVGVESQGIFHWTGGTLDVQDIEIGGTNSRFSVGQTAEFAGALHANGGTVAVDLDDTLTLLGEFGTTQEGKTITKEGAGALRIEGAQVYAAGAILSVAEGTVFMDTAAGDAQTHNLEIDVGGAGSDALVVFEVDEYLSMLHILSGGTVRLGEGCDVLVLDMLWIDGVGQFQNVRMTNTPEPATMALVAFGGLAAWARRRATGRVEHN